MRLGRKSFFRHAAADIKAQYNVYTFSIGLLLCKFLPWLG